MKFTLGELFLLAPAIFVAALLTSEFCFPAERYYVWTSEVNRVRSAQTLVESSVRFAINIRSKKLHVSDVNRWLKNELPSDHEASDILMDSPRPDSWGNSYRIQLASKLTDGNFRLYSMGRDGVTSTDGNDPDDIRSWDESRGAFYQQELFRKDLTFGLLFTLIFTPIVFGCMITTKRWMYPIKQIMLGSQNDAH